MMTGAPDQKLLDTLNAVRLREEELFSVIDEVRATQERGACSIMTGWIVRKKVFEEVPGKADAILARLQALSAMIESDELKRWTLADGISVMPAAHHALVSAAADHPLCLINGDITFEKESFLRRILELVEPEGSRI